MKEFEPTGYLATPPSGNGIGVLVLHAWWGLNEDIKATCDRLAESGYVAFAPDLYHGATAETIAEAEALSEALSLNTHQVESDLADAIRFLTARSGQRDRGLAVIGFSLGAYYALALSIAQAERIGAVVLFYGTRQADYSGAQAAYLGHFAEEDAYEPQSGVDALEMALQQAGHPVTFHRYSGTGHWFFEPARIDAYDTEAASLAWRRTLSFLQQETATQSDTTD